MQWLCMCAYSVSQLCLTLCNPMDYSPRGSSVHGIFLVRLLKWVTNFFSRGSWPRDWTCVSCIGRQILYHWVTWEAQVMTWAPCNLIALSWSCCPSMWMPLEFGSSLVSSLVLLILVWCIFVIFAKDQTIFHQTLPIIIKLASLL